MVFAQRVAAFLTRAPSIVRRMEVTMQEVE